MDMTFYQNKFKIYPASVNTLGDGACFMVDLGDADMLCITSSDCKHVGRLCVEQSNVFSLCELNHETADFLREKFPFTSPTAVLSRETSFGVGDRLGLAGDGLLRVFQEYEVYPILAQQSMREMSLTHRTMADVIDSATFAAFRCGYRAGFGADGDHLKKLEDIREAVKSGYTMITLDCSDYIDNDAAMQEDAVLAKNVSIPEEITKRYMNREFEIAPEVTLTFSDKELLRIFAVYQKAIDYVGTVYYDCLRGKSKYIDFEISIDETLTTTSPLAHFYVANELKIRAIRVATIAPRFTGEFQKGIDYIGDLKQFREDVRLHHAIACYFGYKLSFHSGSDKFAVFPIIAEITGGHFHIKTSGTNWLEAVRAIAQSDSKLFRDIYRIAEATFEKNRANYHVTPNLNTIPNVDEMPDAKLPELLDLAASRQVLHISYGEVLADPDMKKRIYRSLRQMRQAYSDALYHHIGHHADALGISHGHCAR